MHDRRRTTLLLRALAALALVCSAPGCRSQSAAQETSRTDARPAALPDEPLPLPGNAIAVPLVRQKVNYSCGNVAALAILRYWDPRDFAAKPESDLYAPMHTTPQDGTDPVPIVDYIAHVPGLSAELRMGVTVADLTGSIDRGEPAIVDLQAWKDETRAVDVKEWEADWDDGHYAVVMGYDAQELYFMDPSTEGHYAYVPRAEIDARWHDVLTDSGAHIVHAAIFVHGDVGKASARAGGNVSGNATRMR